MRLLKWTAGFVALFVLAAFLFLFFGLHLVKDPIARRVSDATGRELLIAGDLRPVWSWLHPRLRAERVSFANAPWGKEKYLLEADAIEASISVLPLLSGRVVLPEVHLERPTVNLEQDADGRKNWILKEDPEPRQPSRIQIRELTLDHGRLAYADALRAIDVVAELSTDDAGINFGVEGEYNGMALSAAGHGGPVLALRDDDDTPYPLKAAVHIGETTALLEGKITGLVGLSGLDLAINLAGRSMDELYDIVGVAFPTTSPYRTAGRLIRDGKHVRYENFTGKVGESDLAGTIDFDGAGERPVMKGDLASRLLNLADLGPVVGTHQPSKQGVLPDAPFDPARWQSVDADVRLRAGSLRRPEQLPLDNLSTRLRMKDAVLTLDPLEFGTAGGKLAGTIRLDGRKDTIRADARIRVQNLQLQKLFPTVKVTQASMGSLSGAIELAGSGNSVARLLGSASGKIGVFMQDGQVSDLVMQMVAIDLWGITRVKLAGDRQIPIRCVVGDFGVENGVMQTNALVFDTEAVNVKGEGQINLKNEAMDLTLYPQPKTPSLISLRSPLYIRGTFSKPQVRPDTRSIAGRGIGAAALAIVNPLLAVLPLLDEGPGKDSPCGQLIAELTSSARSASSGATAPRPPKQPAR